ncbi:MAG TPA: TAXI family TRAP transporter solute-binding subunit, partial [Xanthobacteraceae bacterium]
MNMHFRTRLLALLAALAPIILALQPANVNAQTQGVRPARATSDYTVQKERMNSWTVGLAGGQLEGAPIRFAAEIARVVDDGPNMLVLPIVTRGPVENMNALLYLRGVDLAIVNSDALEEYKVQAPDIQKRVVYLLNLFPSELHIFVRPEIQSLQDLAGKKVNFNTLGTAAAYSGPLILSRLGIEVEKTFIPHQVALEQMRKGEMAAVVFITSKPVDAFVRGRWDPGFKFIPVTYDRRFEDYYLPSTLEASDYPNLIKQGERVSTIAVPTALIA